MLQPCDIFRVVDLATLVSRATAPGVTGAVRPARPEPFIAPSITLLDAADQRAVMVSAPAAVGKSTVAKWLASETNAHFLDLGQIQVGSQGFIGDLAARGLLQAFRDGQLTVVVDALDEGLVRSGFDNYEAFFRDLAQLAEGAKADWADDATRLVLFGRDEYIDLTALILADSGAQFSTFRLEYMEASQAKDLVVAYARASAHGTFHEGPTRQATEAFFRAAARALDVDYGQLWTDSVGRGFAGYPPVLRAVAEVIAPNPTVALAEWETPTEWHNAWQLLAETANRLLDREREKLVGESGVLIPEQAYDSEHQLTLLARRLTGSPIDFCEGLDFQSDKDKQAFRDAAQAQLEVHPFLAEGASDVFGSIVAAAAIARGEQLNGAEAKVGHYSRWPFMWRFFEERVGTSTPEVAGVSLGWVLASLWTGIEKSSWTTIEESHGSTPAKARIEDAYGEINVFVSGEEMVLRGVCRNLDLELPHQAVRFGLRSRGVGGAVFVLEDACSIQAEELIIDVPEILVERDATVTIDVERCDSPVQRVRRRPSAQLRVSQSIYKYPWSQAADVIRPGQPRDLESEPLKHFLATTAHSLPSAGRPATLDGNGRPLEDDNNFASWPANYREALGSLIRQLRDRGAVTRSRLSVHGPVPTYMYRPEGFSWDDLESGVPEGEPWDSLDWTKVMRSI